MNVLLINTVDCEGGAARVSYSLCKQLIKTKHSVDYFVKVKKTNKDFVHLLPDDSFLAKVSDLLKSLTGKDLQSYLKSNAVKITANDIEWFKPKTLIKTKNYKQADLIHCHNLHGNYFPLSLLSKMSLDKPVIWTLHDMWAITPHCYHSFELNDIDNQGFYKCPNLNIYQALSWDNTKYLKTKKKQIYQKSNFHLVVPCNWLKQKIQKSVLSDKNISVIYNGIDINIFQKTNKAQAKKELGIGQNKKVIMFFAYGGKNNIWKGAEYIQSTIDHFHNQKNVLFLCIGGHIQDAKHNTSQIKYIPKITKPKTMAKYYSASDVFLFPSLAETFPLSMLEALACGTMTVSFNIGGIREIIKHKKNGYLSQYKKVSDLILGIKHVLSLSQIEYNNITNNNINLIKEKFSLNQMCQSYFELYKNLINNKNDK